METYRSCPYCHGSGKDPIRNDVCQVCMGNGELKRYADERLCPVCSGTGHDPYKNTPCRKCKGFGVVHRVHDDGRGNIQARLEHFCDGFIRYRELVETKLRGSLTSEQESELETLSVQLQRTYGSLKKIIEKYAGPSILPLEGGKREYEAFSSAFNYTIFSPGALTAVMDTAIATLNMAIGNLGESLESEQLPREAVFSNGKPYDAYEAIKDIISTAISELIIVDSYVDDTLFTLLGNVQSNVQIQILTQNMKGDFGLAGQKFKKQREKAQQGTLTVRKSSKFHDRFLVVDDRIFHLGASIKDAGDKVFAMSEFEGADIKSELSRLISSYWVEADIVL